LGGEQAEELIRLMGQAGMAKSNCLNAEKFINYPALFLAGMARFHS
jgi:hypothetical protein